MGKKQNVNSTIIEDQNNYYECGNGWLSLIYKVKRVIHKYNLVHKNDKDFEPLIFSQVKEKWGKLNIYLNYYIQRVQKYIRKVELESYKVCECCGTRKNNVHCEPIHGWYMTLCDKCREEEIKRFNKKYENLTK